MPEIIALPFRASMPKAGESPSIAKPLLIMLALMAAIGATGVQLYRHHDRETRRDAQDLVTAVAQQKAQTLEIWLDGRASATNQLRTAPALRESAEQLVTRRDARALPRIRQIIDPERWGTQSVLLLDVQGLPLASVGPLTGISAELLTRARAVAASGTALLHFLHRDADLPGSPIFLDYLVALTAPEGAASPIALLVLRHDPERFLFPLIQSWPARSRSAETLLVRREGDEVLFLNTLRHRADTALRMTRPRTEATLPAAQAVFGLPRLEKNFDYRGIEVVYAHRPIAGTQWHIVAKIDAAEILHSVTDAGVAALAVTLALILVVGASAIMYWRQQLRLFTANRRADEVEREALSKHLDLMSRHANDAIFLYDEAGRILEANERALERYGYPRDELVGMSASRLRAPGVVVEAHAEEKRADEAGSGIYETLHRRKDGSEFPVEVSLRVIDVEGRRLTQEIIRDVSERKRAEAALRESEERYRVIAESASDVILVINENSRIEFANPAGENMFGYRHDELIGQPLTILIPEDLRSAHLEGLKRYLDTGRRGVDWKMVELRGRHKNGTQFPVEIAFGEFVRDGKRAFAGFVRDISERKRAEARIARLASLKDALSRVNHAIVLAKNEQPLFDEVCAIMVGRAGFDYAGVGIADLDSGEIRWVAGAGAAAATLAQVRRSVRADQPEGRGLTGIAVRERRHVVSQDFLIDPLTVPWHKLGRKLGIGSAATFPIMRAGAAVGVVNVYARARQAFDDEVVALLDEAAQDVSFALNNIEREAERMRIDEALRESEARYRSLFENLLNGFAYCKMQYDDHDRPVDFVYLSVNDAFERLTGLKNVVGKQVTEVIPGIKELNPELFEIYGRVASTGIPETFEIDFKPLRQWFSISVYCPGQGTFVAIFDDITERKRADEVLRESEGKLRAIFEGALDGILVADMETRKFLTGNPAICRMLGYTLEEIVRIGVPDIHLKQDLPRAIEQFERLLRGEIEMAVDIPVMRKDGSVFYADIKAAPIRLGGKDGLLGIFHDITERKRNEAELRAAEEQFRGLVEQSISGIYIIQDGRFAYANPRAAEIFGYAAPEELIGREPVELVAEKDRGLVAENIRRRLAGEVKSIAYTFTGLRKDGTTVEIGVHGSLSTYRGRPAIISAAQDITERKRAEDEIQRHLAELRQAMMATVRVASTMGELRDPYTSGHERRVGEMSAAIGAELGLSGDQVEGLRVAGYLHDLGKIMVPSEILAKPGKISPIEFALIKEHPQQGYEILKDVKFPWPVALVALQHHERLDGTGYPKGLKGDEIVLEARILAVADTVEAMSSHRPYRPGLGLDAALAEIEKHRGRRYDPQAADACLRLFREKGYELPA